MKKTKKILCFLLAASISLGGSSICFSSCSEMGLIFSAMSTVNNASLQNSTALEVMKRAAKGLRDSASLMGEDPKEVVNSVKLKSAKVKVLKYDIAKQTGSGFICCCISYTLGGFTETAYCSASFKGWDNLYNFSSNAEKDWNEFIVGEDYEREYVDVKIVNAAYASYILEGRY